MKIIFLIFQILTATLLITLVILQSKGSGLSQSSGAARPIGSLRGAEKVLFWTVVVLALFFLLSSLINVILV